MKISKNEYKISQKIKTIKGIKSQIDKNPALIRKFISSVKHNGLRQTISRMKEKVQRLEIEDLSGIKYTFIEPELTNEIKKEIVEFSKKPLISIIMPVYNVDPKWLDLAIKSIENQWYENWELCIADDKKTIDYLKSKNS